MIRQAGLGLQLCLICCMSFSLTGCGRTEIKVESQSQPAPAAGKENLKKRLEAVAETGSGGSGLAGLREAMTELKKTEPALADQLLSDLSKLERTEDAAKIKTIAAGMVKKL